MQLYGLEEVEIRSMDIEESTFPPHLILAVTDLFLQGCQINIESSITSYIDIIVRPGQARPHRVQSASPSEWSRSFFAPPDE